MSSSHPLALAMALTLAAGCASAPPDRALRDRARQRVLAGKSCPDKQVAYEDPLELRFVLTGCNVVARVKVNCDASECLAMGESSTALAQPQRLQSSDGKVWVDPAPPPPSFPRIRAQR